MNKFDNIIQIKHLLDMDSKLQKNDLDTNSELLEIVAIQERLEMSFEERIDAHENARRFFEDLKLAGEKERAKSQGASRKTFRK